MECASQVGVSTELVVSEYEVHHGVRITGGHYDHAVLPPKKLEILQC